MRGSQVTKREFQPKGDRPFGKFGYVKYTYCVTQLKNLIRLILVSVLLTGCSPSNSLSGSDNYEVQWSGTAGSKLFGSYVVGSRTPGIPTRVEKVGATLPYKITFSAPKNSLITAAGATFNQGIQSTVEIKIFKNGSECDKVGIVGSGAMNTKVCQ